MSHEPWSSELNPNEVESVPQVGVLSDGTEETVFDYEDVRDYDLGEGD